MPPLCMKKTPEAKYDKFQLRSRLSAASDTIILRRTTTFEDHRHNDNLVNFKDFYENPSSLLASLGQFENSFF